MKTNDKWNICISVVFLLWIFGCGIFSLIAKDRAFSEMENRYLKTVPTFHWNTLMDGSLEEDIETYLSDQFIGKDMFMELYQAVNYSLGIHESNDVYYGKEDTLLKKYTGDEEAVLSERASQLKDFAASVDVPVAVSLIPGAATIWSDRLPANAPNQNQQTVIDAFYDETGLPAIDNCEMLKEHAEEYIYYHTDHHWTSLGAYYGYAAAGEVLGYTPVPLTDYDATLLSDAFKGSLYSKAPGTWVKPDEMYAYVPDDGIEVTVYDGNDYTKSQLYVTENLEKKDKYSTFLGGNQPLMIVKSNHAPAGKLLLIRDSYSDSLVPFLTAHYAEIHMLDPRYYKQSAEAYIEENEIDSVLFCFGLEQFEECDGLRLVLKQE